MIVLEKFVDLKSARSEKFYCQFFVLRYLGSIHPESKQVFYMIVAIVSFKRDINEI